MSEEELKLLNSDEFNEALITTDWPISPSVGKHGWRVEEIGLCWIKQWLRDWLAQRFPWLAITRWEEEKDEAGEMKVAWEVVELSEGEIIGEGATELEALIAAVLATGKEGE